MITVKLVEGNSGVNELSNITVDYLLELLLSHKSSYIEIKELMINNYRITDINKLASVLL